MPADQDDEQALYGLIESALADLAAHGHRVVCCIDEAHAMAPASLEALRLLSNIETDKRKLMQIVLFGQPELDQLLSRPELRSLRSRLGAGFAWKGCRWLTSDAI